ncbi:MAG TPA: hypothetical protein VMV52_01720 [Candidatus Nanopelagicaceae bacterium]|nr:hypothetical protein [Candidatus Nanopelagicaceae bacterium]
MSLSGWEQLAALHADIRIPLHNIADVEISDRPWRILRGIRAPGTGFPGVIMVGTMRWKKRKDFCAIYGRRPVIVVNLRNEAFSRLIVTCDQPAQLVQLISASSKLR